MILGSIISIFICNVLATDLIKSPSVTVYSVKLEMTASNSYSLTDEGLERKSAIDSNLLTDVGVLFTIRNNDSVSYYIDELLPLINNIEIEVIDDKGNISAWDWGDWAEDVSCLSSSLIFIHDFNQGSSEFGGQEADVFQIPSIKNQYEEALENIGLSHDVESRSRKNRSISYLNPGQAYSRYICLNYFLNSELKYRVRLNYPSQPKSDPYSKLMNFIELPSEIAEFQRFNKPIISDWIEFGPYVDIPMMLTPVPGILTP